MVILVNTSFLKTLDWVIWKVESFAPCWLQEDNKCFSAQVFQFCWSADRVKVCTKLPSWQYISWFPNLKNETFRRSLNHLNDILVRIKYFQVCVATWRRIFYLTRCAKASICSCCLFMTGKIKPGGCQNSENTIVIMPLLPQIGIVSTYSSFISSCIWSLIPDWLLIWFSPSRLLSFFSFF